MSVAHQISISTLFYNNTKLVKDDTIFLNFLTENSWINIFLYCQHFNQKTSLSRNTENF